MRILVATTHRGVVGGIETYLHDLLPALAARGHDLAVLYEHGDAAHDAAGDAAWPAWYAGGNDRNAALQSAAAWHPDVAYIQGIADPGLEEWLVRQFPAVRFAHGYVGTCVSGTKRHAFPWQTPCVRTFGPACLGLYYPRRCGGLDPRTLVRDYQAQRERWALLGRYPMLVVASRHMREEYLRHGFPPERVTVLPLFPSGVAPDMAPPARRPPTDRVVFVGRLTDLKGGAYLVRAVAATNRQLGRTLRLVVGGDGPERPTLERLAGHAGVPADFCGWIGPQRRTELMRGADLLAVPSVWPEPFGLVGLEAACVGLPAVAFGVGGIPDWLRPGISGELAPGDPPTISGLTDALVRALVDRERHQRLRMGAWKIAHDFTMAHHLTALETFLQRAAEGTVRA